MDTLRLDPVTWDLTLDANGNVAVATGLEALAQDAASSLRLFEGELWYDKSQGVPYFAQILGSVAPTALVKAKLAKAALTVPGIIGAKVFFTAIVDRRVSGQVQVTDETGKTGAARF